MQIEDFLEILFQGITAIAIIFAAIQIKINRKQLNISVIEKCFKDFRELGKLDLNAAHPSKIKAYIEIVNEELFYMQRGYLPEDICLEWLDGIIEYLPLYDKYSNTALNPQNCFSAILENPDEYLRNYSRVLHVLTIDNTFDFAAIYSLDKSELVNRIKERKKLIKHLKSNLKNFDFYS